jgi:hypothetical protein
LRNAVHVDNATAEVNAVPRKADDALDQGYALAIVFEDRLIEDDYVIAANLAVMKRRPRGGWRERRAVDDYMVAH